MVIDPVNIIIITTTIITINITMISVRPSTTIDERKSLTKVNVNS